jgi:hypothetical protein
VRCAREGEIHSRWLCRVITNSDAHLASRRWSTSCRASVMVCLAVNWGNSECMDDVSATLRADS